MECQWPPSTGIIGSITTAPQWWQGAAPTLLTMEKSASQQDHSARPA
jgi:hypothetical protein